MLNAFAVDGEVEAAAAWLQAVQRDFGVALAAPVRLQRRVAVSANPDPASACGGAPT